MDDGITLEMGKGTITTVFICFEPVDLCLEHLSQ